MEYFQISEPKILTSTEIIILQALDYTSKFDEIKDYLENIDFVLSTKRVYYWLSSLVKKGFIKTVRDKKDTRNVHYIKIGEDY